MSTWVWVLIIIVSPFLLWIGYIFFKSFKYNKSLYKSTFKQVFKNKISLIVIVLFYGLTFGLVGGLSTFLVKTEDAVDNSLITNKASSLFSDELEVPNNWYPTDLQYDTMGFGTWAYGDLFTDALNDANYIQLNWWTNYGENYFYNESNIAQYLIIQSFFNEQNLNNEYEMIFDYQMQWSMTPDIIDEITTSYAFLGVNLYDPFTGLINDIGDDNNLFYSQEQNYYINEPLIINGDLTKLGNNDNNTIKLGVQEQWMNENNLELGDTFFIDFVEFEIIAKIDVPNWIFPIHSIANPVVDFETQSYFLIANYDLSYLMHHLLKEDEKHFAMNYGYTDIFDSLNDYKQFYEGTSTYNELLQRNQNLSDYIENFGISNRGDQSFTGSINTLDSARTSIVLPYLQSDQTLIIIMFYFFLIIIIIVLLLLLKKRVQDDSVKLGTLKAMGMKGTYISTNFTIYPIILTILGGFVAIGLSIWIQNYLLNFSAGIFSLSMTNILLPFGTILLVLILPLIINIIISFLITIRFLKKPSLELLSDINNKSPNILVKSANALTPKFASFSFSYKFTGTFKAVGKSLFLAFSIFGATALVSLSMSSSTLVDNVISETQNMINFDAVTVLNPNPYSNYVDESTSGSHIDNSDALTFNIIEEDISNPGYYYINQQFLDTYRSLIASSPNADNAFNYLVSTLPIDQGQWNILENNGANSYVANYYIPFELAATIWILTWEMNNINSTQGGIDIYTSDLFTATTVETFNDSIFFVLAQTITDYLLDNNYTFSKVLDLIFEEVDINGEMAIITTPEVFIAEVQDYKIDVIFGDFYYDDVSAFYQDSKIINDTSNITEQSSTIVSIYETFEQLEQSINLGNDVYEPLENYNGNNIPIIIHTSNLKWLEDWVDINSNNEFNALFEFSISNNASTNYDFQTSLDNFTFEIVSVYDTTIPYGIFSTWDNVENGILFQNSSYNNSLTFERDFYLPSLNNNSINSFTNDVGGDVLFDLKNNNISTLDLTQTTYQSVLNGPIEYGTFDSDYIYAQVSTIYDAIDTSLILIAFFALFVGFSLMVISLKEIIDSSKKEVAMLKTFGYTTWKSTSLVLTPHIILSILVFIAAIPLSLLLLNALGVYLTSVTGLTFIFGLTTQQLLTLTGIIISLVIFLILLGYVSYKRKPALEVLNEN